MDILESYGIAGLVIGFVTFFIIGLFHPLVIKGEYYFGSRCWLAFFIAGCLFCGLSLWTSDTFWSIVFGVLCASSFWGILEVFAQKKRVEKGWFPMNPKHRHRYRKDPTRAEEANKKEK